MFLWLRINFTRVARCKWFIVGAVYTCVRIVELNVINRILSRQGGLRVGVDTLGQQPCAHCGTPFINYTHEGAICQESWILRSYAYWANPASVKSTLLGGRWWIFAKSVHAFTSRVGEARGGKAFHASNWCPYFSNVERRFSDASSATILVIWSHQFWECSL